MAEKRIMSCPFCGKTAATFATCMQVRACAGFRQCEDGHYACVVCAFQDGGCGASTGFFPTREEAADAWNRRANIGNTRTEAD